MEDQAGKHAPEKGIRYLGQRNTRLSHHRPAAFRFRNGSPCRVDNILNIVLEPEKLEQTAAERETGFDLARTVNKNWMSKLLNGIFREHLYVSAGIAKYAVLHYSSVGVLAVLCRTIDDNLVIWTSNPVSHFAKCPRYKIDLEYQHGVDLESKR